MAESAAVAPSTEAILDAAEHLILSKGYTGFSMRELAQESGVAKGTIYHYFRDKQDIYVRVLERDLHHVSARVAVAAHDQGDSVRSLRAILVTYFALITERRYLITVAMREDVDLKKELRGIMQRHRSAVFRPVAAVIERGISEGLFRNVNVELTVVSLLGIVSGFFTQYLFDQLDIDDEVVEHTLTLLLHGIGLPNQPSDATQ